MLDVVQLAQLIGCWCCCFVNLCEMYSFPIVLKFLDAGFCDHSKPLHIALFPNDNEGAPLQSWKLELDDDELMGSLPCFDH